MAVDRDTIPKKRVLKTASVQKNSLSLNLKFRH